MKAKKMKNQKGFTLVELAIVMIIIGLLIGGVLKGQELIENAKVSAVISEVNGLTAAHYTFIDTYGAIPGDIANAAARVKGCEAGNSSDCVGGNGNSIVGPQVCFGASVPAGCALITFTSGAWMIPDLNSGGSTSANAESTQYWKHLALADLITGVNPGADTTIPVWGETNPASPFGGGYTAAYWNYSDTAGYRVSGSTYFLTREVDDFSVSSRGEALMSTKAARNIDLKLDDGKPYAGNVWALNPTSECLNYNSGFESAEYVVTPGRNCNMWFHID